MPSCHGVDWQECYPEDVDCRLTTGLGPNMEGAPAPGQAGFIIGYNGQLDGATRVQRATRRYNGDILHDRLVQSSIHLSGELP